MLRTKLFVDMYFNFKYDQQISGNDAVLEWIIILPVRFYALIPALPRFSNKKEKCGEYR